MAKKKTRKNGGDGTAYDSFELRQPDRSGLSQKTLLDLAKQKTLFEQAELRQRQLDNLNGKPALKARKKDGSGNDDGGGSSEDSEDDDSAIAIGVSPFAERILDTVLWSVSLAMLHFTLDVLVHNQYAISLEWRVISKRTARAFPVFSLIFYYLHRHPSDPRLLAGLPARLHDRVRQAIFFVASAIIGCYLVHITNRYGYMAVMKQAPPIGCLWVWSVIELELVPAMFSLAITGSFMWLGEYGF